MTRIRDEYGRNSKQICGAHDSENVLSSGPVKIFNTTIQYRKLILE